MARNPFVVVANAYVTYDTCHWSEISFLLTCRNPVARERPSFHDIMLLLDQNKPVVLEIPQEDLASHPKAGELGASLEAGKNMYSELQHTYL